MFMCANMHMSMCSCMASCSCVCIFTEYMFLIYSYLNTVCYIYKFCLNNSYSDLVYCCRTH